MSYSVGMVACVFVGGRGQRYERACNERSCSVWVTRLLQCALLCSCDAAQDCGAAVR